MIAIFTYLFPIVVPKFINGATTIASQMMSHNNKVSQRAAEEEQFHIYDTYSIGNSFKGLTVKFEDASIVENLVKEFSKDILKIIPDQDIQFDLPKPNNKKRFLARSEKRAERQGNYDPEHFFDEDIEEAQAIIINNTTLAARAASDYVQQSGAQWNLVRVSQRTRALTKPYIYDSDAG